MERYHVGAISNQEMWLSQGKQRYSDIFDLKRPVHKDDWFSVRHPNMPARNRAKLFSAFDALDGYSEAIQANGISYSVKRELSEEETEVLSDKLNLLILCCPNSRKAREIQMKLKLCFFASLQEMPEKGQEQSIEGVLTGIDPVLRRLVIGDVKIDFDDILQIDFI